MRKIAIIEDDESVRLLYQMKLEKEGFEVAVARDGVEGIEVVKSFNPDLILLDLMLPQLSGDQALAKIRNEPWGKTVKVVVMTNLTEESMPPILRELGVSYFVVKALYTPAQLVQVVKRVLAA